MSMILDGSNGVTFNEINSIEKNGGDVNNYII